MNTCPPLARLLLAVAVLLPTAVAAQPDGTASDPVAVGEVLSMLEAELSEKVILAWLDGSGRPPVLPSSSELIELKRAGASEAFLASFIERARPTERSPAAPEPVNAPTDQPPAAEPKPATTGTGPPAEPTRQATPTREPRSEHTAPSAPAAPSGSPQPATQTAAPGAAKASPLTDVRLTYSPRGDDEDEVWDFYVYLDGKPLSWVPESGVLDRSPGVSFTTRLAPGKHRLRVSLERHESRRGRWHHTARFSPTELRFELTPGAPARLDVALRDRLLDLGGGDALHLRLRQEDRAHEITGASDPETWPELCEAIAASPPSRSERTQARREAGCVAWDDLWKGQGAPPRHEVREALRRFDFRPVPKGS